MSWWRVCIEVPQDLAETLAWLIAEETSTAVEVQDLQTITRADGAARLLIGLAEAPEADFLAKVAEVLERFDLSPHGRLQDADTVPASDDAGAASPLGGRLTVEHSHDEGWRESWKQFLRGGQVSDRVWVRPPWEAPQAGAAVTVVIEPGMAFGTGQHQTTRGCIRMLDKLLAAAPGEPVLDVGCGSAILCIVAALLGSDAVGVEVDHESFGNAHDNLAINAVDDKVCLIEGSADAVEGTFPVVVANILAGTLVEIAAPIRARAARDLVLAGLMLPDVDRVVAAYPDFDLQERLDDGEWAILHLRRHGAA